MSKIPCRTVPFVLVLLLLLPITAAAQAKEPQRPASEKPKAAKAPTTLPLRSLTFVSPDEAAREIAETRAKARASKKTAGISNPTGTGNAADGAVLELHPTDSPPLSGSATATFLTMSQKKSVLKDIHGSIYGGVASGTGLTNVENGAVGADSGNGKLNVYLEGEQAHVNTPAPH
jgi:hypothetical protein